MTADPCEQARLLTRATCIRYGGVRLAKLTRGRVTGTMKGEIEIPPITHEAEALPYEMTPEQRAAYREYMDHRPEDPEERARLRRIIFGWLEPPL